MASFILAVLTVGLFAGFVFGCFALGCWVADTTIKWMDRRLDRSVRSDFWGGA